MKNESRETIERINSVINGLGKDSKWSKTQRKIKWEIEHHQERLLWKRQDRANAHFEHSKENIEKLLKLNKHLHELQDECAKTAFNIYKDLIALMKQGKAYYKTFCIESKIIYESEDCWEDEFDGLSNSYDRSNYFSVCIGDAPDKEPADYKAMNAYHEKLNWNIEILNLPEFKDEYICYAMHKFFADSLFSLEDALRMKLEDFHVHTEISI